ncbi:MAG: hypothetical protein CML67_11340 [Rhodobacteraceae bacterium]|nr:hypothetical protein [Paracoccaceae bacterium]
MSGAFPDFVFAALLAVLTVGGTVALAIGSYLLGRKLLLPLSGEETRDLAGSVIFRVSALHGLILALVFAEEIVNVNGIKQTTSRESALIADIYYDLKRYEPEQTAALRTELATYVALVVNDEWRELAENRRLSAAAWDRWSTVYSGILDLAPQTPRQVRLQETLQAEIREISRLRRQRENAALSSVNPFFMAAAVIGVVLTSLSFFTFAPTTVNLVLLSVFGIYTGMIIFFVTAFSNPYLPPGAIEPVGFQQLFQGEVRADYEASLDGSTVR